MLPDFVGMTIEEAEEKAQKSELELQIEYRDSEDGEEGVILGQDPEYDESAIIKIDKGSTVTVYVSKLPGDDDEKIKIPDYTGKDYEDVRERLIKLGFDKNNISIIRQEDEDIDEDCVIKTFPGSGSEVPRDSEIKIYVSKGKENDIAVPYLVGSTVDGARQLLSSEGLKGGRVDYRESDKPEGTVIEQDPVSGTKVNKGFSVNLVVSSGKETEPTPTPSQVPTPTQEPEEQDTTEQNNTEASEPKTSGDSSSAGESQSTVELGE